jgi:phosphoribosylaminoimidazolecarboxamide formyltransferase / IMP cyclohydrolase
LRPAAHVGPRLLPFMPMPRALISVSDKTGLAPFAQGLAARGYQLVSTGGTARALDAAGVAVTPIFDVTGFPEILDGRVKTLHPAVHGGILARRRRPDDLAVLTRHGIGLIDIVAVNLYPFVKAAATPDIAFDALVEEIDIGGPSMVRSAAKNFQDVLVVVDPADYEAVLAELDRPDGPTRDFRFSLARKAFAHTASYDAAIAGTLSEFSASADGFARAAGSGVSMPGHVTIGLGKIKDLRYGENPHQPAAWYGTDPSFGLGAASVLQGKELSFTNLLDLDSAARIAREFDEPAAAVIKHTNPCGAAVGADVAAAYVRARDADSLAAFGGIVGLNRPIDEETARALVSTFIEAVIAPGVTEQARPVLAARANMRVVVADLTPPAGRSRGRQELRSILGAVLMQERDEVLEARAPWSSSSIAESGLRVATLRAPGEAEWRALRFAWRICAHVKSNAVIFTNAESTLAIGAGQMSRVDAVQVAVMKAGGHARLAGSVAASDAFFPFRDGIDALAAAGATAVIQPGGSVRDPDVIAAANEHGLAMVFTGRRHFRH